MCFSALLQEHCSQGFSDKQHWDFNPPAHSPKDPSTTSMQMLCTCLIHRIFSHSCTLIVSVWKNSWHLVGFIFKWQLFIVMMVWPEHLLAVFAEFFALLYRLCGLSSTMHTGSTENLVLLWHTKIYFISFWLLFRVHFTAHLKCGIIQLNSVELGWNWYRSCVHSNNPVLYI